jgi:predicted patatin/cPLA2 family phospholipase
VDGGTVNPLTVNPLIGKGVGCIVAILTRPLGCDPEPPGFLERILFWRYFQNHTWMLRKIWEAGQACNDQVLFLEELSRNDPPEALVIAPDTVLPARMITRDKRKINRTVDLG